MRAIKKIVNNNFFRSIATLMSGTLIAQFISFIISPLMTRLYTEEEIGEYTLLLTAISMFGAVICGRYDMSIVGEKDDKGIYSLIKLSFVLTLLLSFIIGVGYSVYFCLTDSLQMPFLQIFSWLFVFFILTGIGHILQSYNNRDREYKLMASVSVVKEIGKATSLVGLGFLKFGTIGLLISYLISLILGIGRQAKRLKSNFTSISAISRSDMLESAKKHRDQPMFSVPASFANSFSYSVINIFIERLFGTVILAYYSMSFRMLGIPLTLVSMTTSKAYYEKASREYEQIGYFKKTFIQTSLFLLTVAIPMVFLLIILAPWAFEVFFGKGWDVSGEYVRYLAPMFGIRLVVSALAPTMIICKKQRVDLFFQFIFIIAAFLAYMFGKQTDSVANFLQSISALFSLIYIIYYLYMLKLSLRREKND